MSQGSSNQNCSSCGGVCGDTMSLCDVISFMKCIKDVKVNFVEKRQEWRPTTPTNMFTFTSGILPTNIAAIKVEYNGLMLPFGAPGPAGPAWTIGGGNTILLSSNIGEPVVPCVLVVKWTECQTILDVLKAECPDIYQKLR